MKKNKPFSPQKKDTIKIIRGIMQGIILIVILFIGIKAFFSFNTYVSVQDKERNQTEKGFIALSYFGIDRSESETLISTNRFDEHLKALKESGYVTITQKDIMDYYKEGKALPEKSLFLILEDGRRDTAIFAQNILETHNFKGNILTYAQNLEKTDPKFLSPKDLKELEKSTFWELGTNGYRLVYINVFNRYERFLNTLDTYEFKMMSPYLDRNYNHYLMDYIRNEIGVPTESLQEMEDRIAYDYKKIREIYTNKINKIPDMYILMHSNSGQFGTNDKVSYENEKWVNELFKMNFNREGNSLNINNSSIYDLTRIQPQASWQTNHLLMRIWDDTKTDLAFVSGDLKRKKDWDTLEGESEFIDETIALTSLPGKRGLMKLKQSEAYNDLRLSVRLKGNQAGSQALYLRADEALESYIRVEIKNNFLYLYDKRAEASEQELLVLDLNQHDEIQLESKDENSLAAEIRALETRLKYASDINEAKVINELLKEKRNTQVVSIEEGGTEYIPPISLSKRGDRLLDIYVQDNKITISLDEKLVTNKLEINQTDKGAIYLESAFSGYGYSQRNLTDDVYDGVFEDLVIAKPSLTEEQKETILYDNRLKDFEKVKATLKLQWNNIIGWFIKNF
ncbi:MAG TPA: glycoside hydrolase [Epulopiscium sp.]|nr:glycoside hydrolase [Candidatus Epulonipiscium sp.]